MSAIIVLNYFIEYFTYYITIIPDGGGRGALVNGEAEVHPESGLSLFRESKPCTHQQTLPSSLAISSYHLRLNMWIHSTDVSDMEK
eukprot:4861759-Prymnesium_polylepis.1